MKILDKISKTMKNFWKSRKAQLSIYGIIMLVVGLIILSAMFPIIKNVVTTARSNATTTTETLLFDMIPMMFIIAFIASIFIYVSVQRPPQY